MLAFWVMLGFVVLRLVVLAGLALLLLPRGRTCPACREETVPLVSTGLLRLLPIDKRWCTHCGWSWYRKRQREQRAPATVSRRMPSRRT